MTSADAVLTEIAAVLILCETEHFTTLPNSQIETSNLAFVIVYSISSIGLQIIQRKDTRSWNQCCTDSLRDAARRLPYMSFQGYP